MVFSNKHFNLFFKLRDAFIQFNQNKFAMTSPKPQIFVNSVFQEVNVLK